MHNRIKHTVLCIGLFAYVATVVSGSVDAVLCYGNVEQDGVKSHCCDHESINKSVAVVSILGGFDKSTNQDHNYCCTDIPVSTGKTDKYATKTNNMASKYPELLKEWDQEKNKGLNPADFTPHVNKKVWWQCRKGHSWEATIYNRAKNKSGCPVCVQNNRRKNSIKRIQEIIKKRGGKWLANTYANSKSKIKLSCKEGHIWETRADNILYANKWCPVCRKKVRK